MLFYSGSDGENVGIEDYILRVHPGFFGEETVGSGADLYLSVEGCCLTFFVKCHYYYCCSEGLYGLCLFDELFRAFLEADGVHDAFALGVLEACDDGFPV